jgi:hypothetical protein
MIHIIAGDVDFPVNDLFSSCKKSVHGSFLSTALPSNLSAPPQTEHSQLL